MASRISLLALPWASSHEGLDGSEAQTALASLSRPCSYSRMLSAETVEGPPFLERKRYPPPTRPTATTAPRSIKGIKAPHLVWRGLASSALRSLMALS